MSAAGVMRRVALAAALVLLGAAPARAATTTIVTTTTVAATTTVATTPVFDERGRVVDTPFAPTEPTVRLTQQQATDIFVAYPKVRKWLKRYPTGGRITDAQYTKTLRSWEVKVWSGDAGEVATGRVDDVSGSVTEAWTGPQVAWKMARGYSGAFGGTKINSYRIWLAFCVIFLVGLVDWRRIFSLRTLDLLVLLSFSVSLWFFNRGDVFTSMPLAYPPLLYLIARGAWAGFTGRGTPGKTVWPVWILVAATVFVTGFRVGLNLRSSNVIDVGYAGVIGADRIVHGQMPYGHMPVEDDLKACGPKDSEGEIRDRVQTNGRCESANDRGDTYGPVAYLAYVPAYLGLGWSGKWDTLPAAHATSVAFDLICIAGLALIGLRLGGASLGATLAFAWAAYPFTQYASNSNTNDSILPAFLIWGFLLATSPFARGVFGALAAWTKFAALLVAPLWATYPDRRPRGRFLAGYALATAAAFSLLLLEPNVGHAARVFWDRTFSWQLARESPFSIWDWRQYHAGLPDLHLLQRALEVVVVGAAVAFAFVPRTKSPLQLAALTGVLLLGFELVLTHWFFLYIPWFFPFAAFVALAPAPARRREPVPEDDADPVPELVPA